jgi:hypothetical protein
MLPAKKGTLMQGIRLNIQYVQFPVCGLPAGYIQDKSKGITFINQSEFASRKWCRCRI